MMKLENIEIKDVNEINKLCLIKQILIKGRKHKEAKLTRKKPNHI